MSGSKQYLLEAPYSPHRLAPLCCTLLIIVMAFIVTAFETELHEVEASEVLSRLCWRNSTVRPPVLLATEVIAVATPHVSLLEGADGRRRSGRAARR